MVLTVTTISAGDLTELIGIDVDIASGLIAAIREGLPFDEFVNLQHVLEIAAAVAGTRRHDGQNKMAGFRNIVVHSDQSVDPNIMRDIVENRLGDLIDFTTAIRTRLQAA